MYATYTLEADELDQRFLDMLKTLFNHRKIEISICEAAEGSTDETAYLLESSVNRERLLAAIENVESGENLIGVDLKDLK